MRQLVTVAATTSNDYATVTANTTATFSTLTTELN